MPRRTCSFHLPPQEPCDPSQPQARHQPLSLLSRNCRICLRKTMTQWCKTWQQSSTQGCRHRRVCPQECAKCRARLSSVRKSEASKTMRRPYRALTWPSRAARISSWHSRRHQAPVTSKIWARALKSSKCSKSRGLAFWCPWIAKHSPRSREDQGSLPKTRRALTCFNRNREELQHPTSQILISKNYTVRFTILVCRPSYKKLRSKSLISNFTKIAQRRDS